MFLSITLLNWRVYANDFAIEAFEYGICDFLHLKGEIINRSRYNMAWKRIRRGCTL